MNFNKVIIAGRVTADPELRTTPDGQSVTTLGVATNRAWTEKNGAKQEEVEYHSVVVFGKTAEVACRYLKKGSAVLFEGRLRTREWADRQGQQRRVTEIVCELMELGPRPTVADVAKAPVTSKTAAPRRTPEGKPMQPLFGGEEAEEIKPEDVPF